MVSRDIMAARKNLKSIKQGSCLLWPGDKFSDGFGKKVTNIDGKTKRPRVHVWEWTQRHGQVPEGAIVAHTCGQPLCHNIEHLKLVYSQEEADTFYIEAGTFKPRKHWLAKLTDDQVLDIKTRLNDGVMTATLAKQYGVDPRVIFGIRRGWFYKHVKLDGESDDVSSGAETVGLPDCKIWTGAADSRGTAQYASRDADGRWRRRPASVLTWEMFHGPVPQGYVVLRVCDNPMCVFEPHMKLATKLQATRLSKFSPRRRGSEAGTSKLSEDDVREIKRRLELGDYKTVIARDYGVTPSAIASIQNGRTWSHLDGDSDDADKSDPISARRAYLESLPKFPADFARIGAVYTSERLLRGKPYTRIELREMFALEETANFAQKVYTLPRGQYRSIWIFADENTTSGKERATFLDDDTLIWECRQREVFAFRRHQITGNELCVFKRVSLKGDSRFEYIFEGTFSYAGDFDEAEALVILKRGSDPIFDAAVRDIEAFIIENGDGEVEFLEGEHSHVLINRYERDPAVRAAAIKIHGEKCIVCGFCFGDVYGEHGQGFIQVHHLKPISEYGGEVVVNPETEMTSLCANCHVMVHRDPRHALTIDELRQIMGLSTESKNPNGVCAPSSRCAD
jgi:5-methylcytosine-specific restriction protein A